MKKNKLNVAIVLLATIMLGSCGGSIRSDAKKVAKLQCKAQELMSKAASGDNSVMEESTELVSEAQSLSRELEAKYTSESDKKEFAEALREELGKCK